MCDSQRSPKLFTSSSPHTDEPTSTPDTSPVPPSSPPQDLQLCENEEGKETKETSLEATSKDSEDSQGSPQSASTNPPLTRLRRPIQNGSQAKRFKESHSDEEREPSQEPERRTSSNSQTSDQASTGSESSEISEECALTRSAPRISGESGNIRADRDFPALPPEEPPPPPHTPPHTPPCTLAFQFSTEETHAGGEPSVIVTPENKVVTPNNGPLAIGELPALPRPQQPDVNNDAMLDNNKKPFTCVQEST